MIIVKKSKIGFGLFTNQAIPSNKLICEIKGAKVHYSKLLQVGGDFQNNAFRYSLNYYLSPGQELGNFLNHACQPNCRIVKKQKKLYLYAIKQIKQGSEILLDYSTILASDDTWTMRCKCKQTNCRKTIASYDKLPKKLLALYVERKIVPDYIRRLG